MVDPKIASICLCGTPIPGESITVIKCTHCERAYCPICGGMALQDTTRAATAIRIRELESELATLKAQLKSAALRSGDVPPMEDDRECAKNVLDTCILPGDPDWTTSKPSRDLILHRATIKVAAHVAAYVAPWRATLYELLQWNPVDESMIALYSDEQKRIRRVVIESARALLDAAKEGECGTS